MQSTTGDGEGESGDDGRHARIVQLFLEASALSSPERPAFLASACGDDRELRAEVESLLVHAEGASVEEAGRAVADALGELAGEDTLPAKIGEYKILARIGAGGMGVVYEAEQARPRRNVALKVIRPGLATPALLRRFEHEAEVLGWLDHPGIARIYEAGTADEGAGPQPYFAMELVRGAPLHRYAAERGLDIDARLELVARVAEAVRHAHQKGIVHRDLKPANVLVDESGQPKVLDFGVARVTGADLETSTVLTRAGELVGTLPYMSPEQVAGDPARLDARSDVYALGAIAYELLSGQLPHAVAELSLPEAARRISEDEPTTLGVLERRFKGDVETIVGKALEKDPDRRYGSVDELAADIRRYLADEPIVARPPSAIYQLKKFTRRNRLLVGGVALLFVVLLAGIVGVSIYAVRAETAREDADEAAFRAEERRIEAERQAQRATSVNDFLNDDLLAAADPTGSSDPDLTVRAVLDRASEKIAEGRFRDQPLVRASVLETIGRSYLSLGRFEPAEESLVEAVTLYTAELGSAHPTTLIARVDLTNALHRQQRHREVEPLYVELREALTRTLGEEHPETLACISDLALVHDALGDYDRALELNLWVLECSNRDSDATDAATLMTLRNLGLVHVHREEYEDAQRVYLEVIAGCERLYGSEHLVTAEARAALAGVHLKEGRFEEAIELYLPTLVILEHVLGKHHPDYLVHAGNLGLCYSSLNRFDEAEPIALFVYEARAELFGEDAKDTLLALLNLCALYVNTGQHETALPLLEVAHAGQAELLGAGHDETLLTQNGLAVVYKNLNRLEEAEATFREVLVLRREHSGPDNSATIAAASGLAYFLTGQGRHEEAAPYHAEAVEGALRTMPEHMYTGVFLSRQAVDFLQASRFDEAAAAGEQAHGILAQGLGPTHRRTTDVARLLADVYTALDDPERASEWREAAVPAPGTASE